MTFDKRKYDFYALGVYWLLIAPQIKIQTRLEQVNKWIYAASYNTGVGIKLADGRNISIFAGSGQVSLHVNGSKYTGRESFPGIGVARKHGGKLELDFQTAGLMLHVVPWRSHSAQLAKGMNLIVALKGGTAWSSVTGLCGNINGDGSDDGSPKLRSWPAMKVPTKENMFPVELKASAEMKAAGDACTKNATLKATAQKLCKPIREMADECVKDICITESTEETVKDYEVTEKAATKLRRVVEKKETWTPSEVPTTRSPSPSPSAVPTEFPTFVPTAEPTRTPTLRMTAAPCIPRPK
jgi:hypothetical protein